MKKVTLLIGFLILAACSTPSLKDTSPAVMNSDKVGAIMKGETKAEELTKLLGEPEMIVKTDGGEAYFFKDINLSSLIALVNQEGVVIDYTWAE